MTSLICVTSIPPSSATKGEGERGSAAVAALLAPVRDPLSRWAQERLWRVPPAPYPGCCDPNTDLPPVASSASAEVAGEERDHPQQCGDDGQDEQPLDREAEPEEHGRKQCQHDQQQHPITSFAGAGSTPGNAPANAMLVRG